MKKLINRVFEALYVFGSAFMLFLLIILLYAVVKNWSINYPNYITLDDQLYQSALLITIITVLANWMEGRLKVLIDKINKVTTIKRGNKQNG